MRKHLEKRDSTRPTGVGFYRGIISLIVKLKEGCRSAERSAAPSDFLPALPAVLIVAAAALTATPLSFRHAELQKKPGEFRYH